MPRPSDPELRQWWRELLNSFDPRRYTVAQFCDQNDISVASFYKWRKRFSQAEQAPAILPVQIMGRLSAPEMAAVIRIGGHALIEIQAGHSQMATDIAVALARLTLDGDNTGNQEVTRRSASLPEPKSCSTPPRPTCAKAIAVCPDWFETSLLVTRPTDRCSSF